MKQVDTILYFASSVFQLAAIVFTCLMIATSKFRRPWIALLSALTLMFCYRVAGVILPTSALQHVSPIASLPISVLLFISLFFIRSIARSDQASKATAERRAAERDASEAKFRQLADFIPQLAWMARPDGWIFWYNRRWHEYCGTTPEQMEGWGWTSVHDPNEVQGVVESWKAALTSGQPWERTFPLRRHDGVFRWHLSRAAPFRDADGNIILWFGTNTDITSQRQLAEDRRRLLEHEQAARLEAERVGRLKDEFLATLSHELRTPLNAILGWARLLQTGGRDQTDWAHGLETIERNARTQTRIIEDLLDMSRIISGKIRLDVSSVDVAAIVGDVIDSLRPAIDAKEIRLNRNLSGVPSLVMGDAARLQQVFWNLLSNAVKFTPRGGTIEVSLRRDAAHLQITVSDSGQGIKPDFMPHLFERFRQQDSSTTRRHGGLGLGLSIVKTIVELHGGSVHVHSDGENRGAAFAVALPLSSPHAAPPESTASANDSFRLPDKHEVDLGGVDILVVDDDDDARELARRVLERQGAKVVTAAAADQALQSVGIHLPAVIVCDLGMPGKDGYEFIRTLRLLPPEKGGRVPTVALTAYVRPEDRVKSMAAGFQAHLGKPVEAWELAATVANLAGRTVSPK